MSVNIKTQYAFFLLTNSSEFSTYANGSEVLKHQYVNSKRTFESEEEAFEALKNDRDMIHKPAVLLPLYTSQI